jgi:hypothetical protein
VKGLDEKLPDFWHGFERAAAERIGVYGNATPTDDAEALGVSGGLDGAAGFIHFGNGKKSETYTEHFWKINALLFRAGAKERLWERGEKTGAVAAGTVGVNSTAMGEAF